jgi:hypothetical protein
VVQDSLDAGLEHRHKYRENTDLSRLIHEFMPKEGMFTKILGELI